MAYTVVGLFNNRNQAQAAIRELTERRFMSESINVSNKTVDANAPQTGSEEVIITDSVANFFQSLFRSDKKSANNHTVAASNADSIVTVHVEDDERAREAAFVLDKNGAIDVDGASTNYNHQNVSQASAQSTAADQHAPVPLQNQTTIPIVEEQLEIGKQVVETGGVRVKSRIIEKPVEENVRLRNQYVIVNRRSVNREVSNEDLSKFREGEIEFLELAEVPVITKHARVVEEVEIGKQISEHQETVHEIVRSTDVEVEEIATDVAPANEINNRNVNN